MSIATPTPTVAAIGRLNITGNVIPASWWHNIKLPSGQPDSTAIVLLSEIIYWYRPAEVRDELSGALIGHRRRFRGDKLQRDYQSFADQFGFSKRAATDAIKRLRDAGLITTELRTIKNALGRSIPNVLFVEPVPELIEHITNGTYPPLKRNIPTVEVEDTLQSGVSSLPLKRKTNTEITTKNTTEIITTGYATAQPLASGKTTSISKSEKTPLKEACRKTWEAYQNGYWARYGVDPVRNAKVSSQIKQFVERVGMEAAPHIARFYLSVNNTFYVQKLHPVGCLLADAESLHTQWATGRTMTAARAKQIDSTQTNLNAADETIRMLRARRAANGGAAC
ncbi:hypothetical protein [Yersinia enterocolitica]|uniref:hypothetical protein n=1 Tax=Yersinia enterocolitica TaxID=630 RepID=UPI001F5A0DB3|nr:hypothetical protein [Yersinia enterocolitica]